MKLLFLSAVVTKPNEKGEQKVKKALDGNKRTDENSFPKIWYTSQNLLPPKDIEDDEEIIENGMLFLKEDEFEYESSDSVLNLDEFSSCTDNEKFGSIIYTVSGDELWVHETSYEIYNYITYITRPWWTVVYENFISYFNFFTRKK